VSEFSTPTQIARAALRRLATERIAPTPENFRELYLQIAGNGGAQDEEARAAVHELKVAINTLLSAKAPADLIALLSAAAVERTWEKALPALVALTKAQVAAAPAPATTAAAPATTARPPASPEVSPQVRIYREVLASMVESGLAYHLSQNDDLLYEGRLLAGRIRSVEDDAGVTVLANDLRRFANSLESRAEDVKDLRDGLQRLLRLVIDNIGELVVDDTWISQQLDVVREVVRKPLADATINEAEQFLRQVLRKQGAVKKTLQEAKATIKNMVSTFIDHLGSFSTDTSEYSRKVEGYAARIQAADDIDALSAIAEELRRDTREMHGRATAAAQEVAAAHERGLAAEQRVHDLEAELLRIGEELHHDQLTGALNRRGLNDAFARVAARAWRQQRPLSLALLDVDNFKHLNDTYGHRAGDEALVHLTSVIREVVRPTDVVARFGGEEFVLLFPDTGAGDAAAMMTHLQRELTKRFFLHNNERVLITFSAGIAQWLEGEDQDKAVARADTALYRAKTTGRNKVVVAPLPEPAA
jgi:diguanylate cyclase